MRTTISACGTKKTCGRCKTEKPLDQFNRRRHPNGTLGYHSYCKPCNNKTTREWTYGMTQGEYDQMMEDQGGLCAMCGGEPTVTAHGTLSLNIDHDHETGKVRALLCGPCNRGLGDFGDSIKRLEMAIAYLRTHGGQ